MTNPSRFSLQGDYVCVAENEEGEGWSDPLTVRVLCKFLPQTKQIHLILSHQTHSFIHICQINEIQCKKHLIKKIQH